MPLAVLLLAPALTHAFAASQQGDFPKWVDFDPPASLLRQALELDIATYDTPGHVDWVQLLAYLAAKYGGDFSLCHTGDLEKAAEVLQGGDSPQDMPGFGYYRQAYEAVLGGFVGEYALLGEEGWEPAYGLKAYSPIAETFPYSDYDDFGVSREYGYRRRHLGHDMMAAVGTPVIAVESGVVEQLGWNQYGGWRVGIRSFDGYRYHYYAHLRKDRPFAEGLSLGDTVMAGDVIGYVGRTGYSATENVNGIEQSHLHYGLQIIFDESQREGNGEIWVDVYQLCRLLRSHQSTVQRNDETKEWTRVQPFHEDIPG
ncbi:M23 family metallopeptidase [Acutalibacter caecimuris]|uniref:M23 family metallopeptidase n=1 Tax=Acutalibacter caecimuris TaxID=3093657 RepID=UPI002AC9EA8D|nr:M23 family metallopeptidase [Acutalibacter sp. M00118]